MKYASYILLVSSIVIVTTRGMEGEQRALLDKRTIGAELISLPASYQQPVPASSLPLQHILAQRNPNHEPLLEPSVRAENIALIKAIGATDVKRTMLLMLGLLNAINAGKDIVSIFNWGFISEYSSHNVTVPNHLLSLIPCYKMCSSICSDHGCFPDCNSTQWICDAPKHINGLGIANITSAALNMLISLGCTLEAENAQQRKKSERERLHSLLAALDAETAGQPITVPQHTLDAQPIVETLDRMLSHDAQQQEEAALDRQRKDLITLLQTTGSLETKAKLYTMLAVLLGLNSIKDLAYITTWGIDTLYPALPLIKNLSAPLIPCKQICWASGCCSPDCDVMSCQTICDGYSCVDITRSPNNFGVLSTVTLVANASGAVISTLLAYSHYKASKKASGTLEQRIQELDKLLEQEHA